MKTGAEIDQQLKIRAMQKAEIEDQLKVNAIQQLEIGAQIEKCSNEYEDIRSERQKVRREWEAADLAAEKLEDAKGDERKNLYKTDRRLEQARQELQHKQRYDIK